MVIRIPSIANKTPLGSFKINIITVIKSIIIIIGLKNKIINDASLDSLFDELTYIEIPMDNSLINRIDSKTINDISIPTTAVELLKFMKP